MNKKRSNVKIVIVLAIVLLFAISACTPAAVEPAQPAQPAATQAPVEPAQPEPTQPPPTTAPSEPTQAVQEPEPTVEVIAEEPEVISEEQFELVISTWGAGYIELINKAVLPELQKYYPNVSLIFDEGGASARYNQLLANKDNPVHDIYICGPEHNVGGIQEGFLEPYDPANVPNAQLLSDWATPIDNMGVAWSGYTYGIGYNPDFFGDNLPKSWNDLWRPEVQGMLVLPAIGHSHMPPFIEKIAETLGDKENNKAAMEHLALLKPAAQTVIYTQWTPQYEAGDVVIMADFDYYMVVLERQGYNTKWVFPEEGALGASTNAAIVKGTQHKDAAEIFLNLMLSEGVQEQVPVILGQTPSRPGIALPDDMASSGLVCCADNVDWIDPAYSLSVRPEWTELMNEIVAPAWGEP